jgi:hypothetical protein
MRLPLVAASGLVALAAGCGPQADPPVDPADAAVHLRAVFDAWKSGEPFESLGQRNPPIVFNEPLWRDGARLLDYEIGDVELHGRQGKCQVKIKVQLKDGKTSDRRIGYQIDTLPSVVIVREGLGP